MSKPGFLLVRSVIENEADRPKFDHWYATDHMPKSIKWMQAVKAWRYWSEQDPAVHYAMYQVADLGRLAAWDASGVPSPIAHEFDEAWPHVPRSRDVLKEVDAQLP